MENKTAAILILAVVASVVVTAGAAYAMGRQNAFQASPYGGFYGPGAGPSMMGGAYAYPGGMMGGYGMMGNPESMYSMHGCMQQYMWHYWNSTTVP